MGIKVFCSDETAPYPRPTVLELTCDSGLGGLFGCTPQSFTGGGFIEQYAAAMRAGWLDRHTIDGRFFLCPSCSGKQPKVAEV